MEELGLTIKKDKVVVSSRDVAIRFEKDHNIVLRAIRSLDIPEDFRLCNFAQSKYTNEQNHSMPEYLMTRDGFTFLAMGFTGKKAAKFKIAYIKAFNEMEKALIERNCEAWIETRRQSKALRRATTDVIKELVDYAIEQGSKNHKYLYANYTKLVKSIAGYETRDTASIDVLISIMEFESIARNMMKFEMNHNTGYKEIYKKVKEALFIAKNMLATDNNGSLPLLGCFGEEN